MTISIHHKLKPFSHSKKQQVLLPGSSTVFTSYPCRLEGYDLYAQKPLFVLDIKVVNYYGSFTTEVDFEKKHIRIFGKPEAGFIEFKVFKDKNSLYIKLERCFQDRIEVVLDGTLHVIFLKQTLKLAEETVSVFDTNEKVFLGCSKKQDLTRIEEDKSIQEYLPYIFSLGTKLKLQEPNVLSYPQNLIKSFHELHQNELLKGLEKCLHGFFSSGFVPSVEDPFYQGLCEQQQRPRLSPIHLLSALAFWFKDALVQHSFSKLRFFHNVPRHLVAGKATSLCFEFGKVHLEWTKGFLRQVVIVIEKDVGLELEFPKNVKSFRLKKNGKPHPLTHIFTKGVYHIDKFQA